MARRRSLLFLLGFLMAAVAVSLVGWFTDVRGVMQSVLIGLFVTAFLPFVFVAAVISVVIVSMLFLAVLSVFGGGDGIAEVSEAGTDLVDSSVDLSHWGAPRYYRLLMSVRHPAIWGGVVGLLAGGLLLWGVVSWIIVPRELVTSRILAETSGKLMEIQKQTGRFPTPSPDGFLNIRHLGQTTDGPVLDGFERPLQFTTAGTGLFASFTLKSVGFDGNPGRDDLCVHGAAKGAEWAGRLHGLLSIFRTSPDGRPAKLKDRLKTLRALRCDDSRSP